MSLIRKKIKLSDRPAEGCSIVCNPFKKEIQFFVDGQIDTSSRLNNYTHRDTWELDGKFVEDLVEVMNRKKIKIYLTGTHYDYEELAALFSQYKNKKIAIELNKYKMIEKLDRREELEELLTLLEKSGLASINTHVIQEMRRKLAEELEIVVVATMSSGKSTLINSLLGQELLPSKNLACTASIVKLKHHQKSKMFKITQVGDKPVDQIATLQEMKQLNERGESPIVLEGRIKNLASIPKVTLVDTPGPNSAQNKGHRKTTYDYIKSVHKPIILVILDGSKLMVDDEVAMLQIIADQMREKEGSKNKLDEDRFLFVINKCDGFKHGKDDSEEVKGVVTKQLRELGIAHPKILLVSGEHALLARKQELSEGEKDQLEYVYSKAEKGAYDFYQYGDLSQSIQDKLKAMEKEARRTKAKRELVLLTSGVVGLEKTIEDIINKYKHVFLVRQMMQECSNKIELQCLQNQLVQTMQDARQTSQEKARQLEQMRNVIRELDKIIANSNLTAEIKKELEMVKFSTQLEPVTQRMYSKRSRLEKRLEDLIYTEINGTKLVRESYAKKFLQDVEKIVGEMSDDLASEYKKIIQQDIRQVGQSIIDKYKAQIRKVIGEIKDIEMDLQEYVCLAIPDFDEFLKKHRTEESEEIISLIKNPEREGFFGFFKFHKPWKVEHVTLKKHEGIEFKVVQGVLEDIDTEIDEQMTQIKMNIQAEKRKISRYINDNIVHKINPAIEQAVRELNSLVPKEQITQQEMQALNKKIRSQERILAEIQAAVRKVEGI